jgi:O-succinylhomoserine sulfhydrylase
MTDHSDKPARRTLDLAGTQIATQAVRAGQVRSDFGEHAEALYMTSSFVFDNAAEAAARFTQGAPGNVYSRFTNPTVTMFEERLAALEGGEAALATASGMSAILTVAMSVLKAGDHVVCSSSVFGATIQLFSNILGRFGIRTTYVDGTGIEAWQQALSGGAQLVFLETPSNPLTDVFDIAAIATLAHEAGALLAVDNCFCSPALQRPLSLGADLVIHSATKYLDGQGRVLGGAIVGAKSLIADKLVPFLRSAGPTMSAFNAWVITKGMETLEIRMQAQSERALALATWLEAHPAIERVFYPGLASHPQHALAMRQQRTGGAIVSFQVKGGREGAWRVIDSTRLVSITANVGDTKSTITHPATTTHGRISPEARARAGITEGLVRVSVGLEAFVDLRADLARGLDSLI